MQKRGQKKRKGFSLLEVLITSSRRLRVFAPKNDAIISNQRLRSFTLLEVLIAGGILFIVSAAIVSLNNSIIQGTSVNADETVLNRWSSEGLELVTASRDNNLLSGNSQNGNQVWLNSATTTSQYGWYILAQSGNSWSLTPAPGTSNTLNLAAFGASSAETLTSQSLTAYRLICIEATGAVTRRDDVTVSCNENAGGSVIVSDGDRTIVGATCDANNTYCANTKPSLNRNTLTCIANNTCPSAGSAKIIPAGNAVKVRSVVVTQNKANYTVSDVATLLTNWKGFEQL